MVCLVEPGCFREVHSFIQTAKGGGGRIDVVALAATEEGDGSTEFEASAAGFAERLQISANREQAARCAHEIPCTNSFLLIPKFFSKSAVPFCPSSVGPSAHHFRCP